MVEPVSTTLGLAAAKGVAGKAGSVIGQRIVQWARGNEARQLVELLKDDHPAASRMLVQPDVLGELWLFAETGEWNEPATVAALIPITDRREEAEALARAIRTEQWRAVREQRRTHFELLLLRDDLRRMGEAQADQTIERIEELLAASRARLPRARQLPAAIDRFVDRLAEIVEAERQLSQPNGDGAARILNISGTSGVGKSTLAIEIARRQPATFDAGVLYLNLRGPDGEPLPASEVAGRLLGDLGVGPESWPEHAGRAALVRSLLAERSTLLVLDNAEDEQQVRELIPANPDSLVLVTSTSPHAGLPCAGLIALEPFSQQDGVELLATFVGARAEAEPMAAAAIADACGGLPLALAVVGARLRKRPTRELSAAASALDGTLQAVDDPRASLRATLTAGLRGLSANARTSLLLIAALEVTDLSEEPLAAISGLPRAEVRRLLEELEDRQLVASGAIHQLVRALLRDLAAEELAEDDVLSARNRRVQWLVTMAQAHISDLDGLDHGA